MNNFTHYTFNITIITFNNTIKCIKSNCIADTVAKQYSLLKFPNQFSCPHNFYHVNTNFHSHNCMHKFLYPSFLYLARLDLLFQTFILYIKLKFMIISK